jgi:type II secretory pathway component PulF
MERELEVLIPIIMFLVIGAVIITLIYFRSREKQMVIERGLDVEVIKEIFKKKENPYALLKAGIIILFFGLGLGSGLLLEVFTGVSEWIPFLIFIGAGIGFIIAFYAGKKAEEKDKILND